MTFGNYARIEMHERTAMGTLVGILINAGSGFRELRPAYDDIHWIFQQMEFRFKRTNQDKLAWVVTISGEGRLLWEIIKMSYSEGDYVTVFMKLNGEDRRLNPIYNYGPIPERLKIPLDTNFDSGMTQLSQRKTDQQGLRYVGELAMQNRRSLVSNDFEVSDWAELALAKYVLRMNMSLRELWGKEWSNQLSVDNSYPSDIEAIFSYARAIEGGISSSDESKEQPAKLLILRLKKIQHIAMCLEKFEKQAWLKHFYEIASKHSEIHTLPELFILLGLIEQEMNKAGDFAKLYGYCEWAISCAEELST